MAIKRTMNLTVYLKDGTSIPFAGDEAQRVLQQYEKHAQGSISKSLVYKDGSNQTNYLEYDQIDRLTLGTTTETTVPDVPCEQIDCIPDYP